MKVTTKLMLDYLVKLGYAKPLSMGEAGYEYELTQKSIYQLASAATTYALLMHLNIGLPTPSVADIVTNTFMLSAYNDLAVMKNAQPSESEVIQLENEVRELVNGIQRIEELFNKALEVIEPHINELIKLIENWSG
jgi:hypothetical protein